MVLEPLTQVRDELRGLTAGLDPELLHGRDAVTALKVCAEIERLAAGARTLLATRVEETRAWAGTGKRSAADWLAAQTGTSVGEAANTLRTGKQLHKLPKVREAVRSGSLSGREAELVAHGAAADPNAQDELLALAGKASLGELRDESQRIVAAAEADEMAAYQRVRRSRFFRHRRDHDGAWVGTIRTTVDCGALLLAAIHQTRGPIFAAARRGGRWDTAEAYDADAVVALAAHYLGTSPPGASSAPPPSTSSERSAPSVAMPASAPPPLFASTPSTPSEPVQDQARTPGRRPPRTPPPALATHPSSSTAEPSTEPPSARSDGSPKDARAPSEACATTAREVPARGARRRSAGSRAPLIARVDHAALLRGCTRPGERCELTGLGPVPVAVVRQLLPRAFLAAVAIDELGQPTRVVHLGRRRGGSPPPSAWPHPPPGPAPPVAGSAPELGRQLKVIVAVPERELARAEEAGSGGSDLLGSGSAGSEPSTDAILAVLLRDGVAVSGLVHHKRHFNVLQRTVLEQRDPQCAVLGCTATAHIQIDHRTDWATTHTTDAAAADRLCTVHHDLKTRHHWQLEPGTGKRRFLPPASQR